MPKLSSVDDLSRLREEKQRSLKVSLSTGTTFYVGMGTCGIAAGARGILTAVMKEIESRNLQDVIVTNSGCAGLCSQEPMMTIEALGQPAPVKYVYLTPDKVHKIVDLHVLKGEVVKEFALAVGSETTR